MEDSQVIGGGDVASAASVLGSTPAPGKEAPTVAPPPTPPAAPKGVKGKVWEEPVANVVNEADYPERPYAEASRGVVTHDLSERNVGEDSGHFDYVDSGQDYPGYVAPNYGDK